MCGRQTRACVCFQTFALELMALVAVDTGDGGVSGC